MRVSLLAVAFLLLWIVDSEGQRFQSVNDQIPFGRADCVYQDSFGFIWFGTVDGLIKFDGYHGINFRHNPGDSTSLPGQEVNAVCQHTDSTLLVGMESTGLCIFNRNSLESTVIRLLDTTTLVNVNCIAPDGRDKFWIGTDHGLFFMHRDSLKYIAHNPGGPGGLQDQRVMKVYRDTHGNLWVGTLKGIHLLDEATETFRSALSDPTFPADPILDMKEDASGLFWISVRFNANRLYYWDQPSMTFQPDLKYCRPGEFRFTFADDNAMWVSSRGVGVYLFENGQEHVYDPIDAQQHGLRALYTRDILHDCYDNVWIIGDEVLMLPGTHKAFRAVEGDGFVTNAVFADDKYIWYSGGVPYRFNRKTGISERFLPEGHPRDITSNPTSGHLARLNAFVELDERQLAFTTTRNIFIWDRETDEFIDHPTKYGGPFRDIIVDQNGMLWIAGNQGAPIRFKPETAWARAYMKLHPAFTPMTGAEMNGVHWWGTESHGLFRDVRGTGEITQFIPDEDDLDHSISSLDINDIHCHSNGEVWIATDRGLDILDTTTSTISHYDFRNAPVNTHITSIIEDHTGALWLGTQRGLVYLNPDSDSLKCFTKADGLINTVYTARANSIDNDGYVYFAGDRGIDYFHPDEVGRNVIPPTLYLSEVRVNNEKHLGVAGENLESLVLNHHQNFIEIVLCGLHFAAPAANVYAYRLPGQVDEWIELGTRRNITLANLAPGTYTLEGKCANADEVWSLPKSLLTIRIRPPFWQTTWFISLCAVLLALMIYALYRYRLQQIRRAEQVKTDFNKRIAEIEMKALRAQMNPHFLFNSLNSVKSLIDQEKNKEAKRYLTRFSQLIRQILNNSRKTFVRLNEELDALEIYLDLEKMRFKHFEYAITVGENVNTDFIDIPPLLFQPYVENAIWHGLLHKEQGPRNLNIHVDRIGEIISITIEDNGIGRKNAQKLQTRSSSKKESVGMKISGDRLKLLQEIYGKSATVEITDLEDPTGTRVEINIPIPD